MTLARWCPVVVLAVCPWLAGCFSPCVDEGDRLVVDVASLPELNDTGSGPQHVRFQVWAIKDKEMFESARPEALAAGESVETFQRQGLGKAFVADTSWIKPGAQVQLLLRTEAKKEFTHVGIAVAYPDARRAVVALDCDERPGYVVEKRDHRVKFVLGRQSVDVGR